MMTGLIARHRETQCEFKTGKNGSCRKKINVNLRFQNKTCSTWPPDWLADDDDNVSDFSVITLAVARSSPPFFVVCNSFITSEGGIFFASLVCL